MPSRERVREILEEGRGKTGRLVSLIIYGLIIISLVAFCIATLPDLDPDAREMLRIVELVTVAVFSIEYLARLWVARSRWRYALSIMGLVDLVAILPFFLASQLDLKAVRIVRGFRVLRILKLARYSRALHRLRRAFTDSREELVLFGFATLIVLFLASVGIYYCERDAQPDAFRSVFDAMWWAVATLTTVGYGDVYPVTAAGKILTFVILMVGLGMVAVPSAVLASALSRPEPAPDDEDGPERVSGHGEAGGG